MDKEILVESAKEANLWQNWGEGCVRWYLGIHAFPQRRRGWGHAPSVGKSENFQKFQNFTSTAHVYDDIMGFECKRLWEKY